MFTILTRQHLGTTVSATINEKIHKPIKNYILDSLDIISAVSMPLNILTIDRLRFNLNANTQALVSSVSIRSAPEPMFVQLLQKLKLIQKFLQQALKFYLGFPLIL